MTDIAREVAKRVMPLSEVEKDGGLYWVHPWKSPMVAQSFWHPDTDIAQAWLVVEEMERRGWRIAIEGPMDPDKLDGWRCSFMRPKGDDRKGHCADDETAPLAICRAALAAIDQ